MLSHYNGKTIRLTTTDGAVFTGKAEAFPSGYGLDTFGVEEESVEINGTHIFLSQIARIEPPAGFTATQEDLVRFDAMTRDMTDLPYRIIDHLPSPVPKDADGQPFNIDRFFRLPPQLSVLRRKQAKILLRMNCYDDMVVTSDGGKTWEKNPAPERFVRMLDDLSEGFMRVVFPKLNAVFELLPNDTQMSVVCARDTVESVRAFAAAEGLFLWDEQYN